MKKPIDVEAVYPLSPMQQGMLYHSIKEPASGVYFEQLSCTLTGTLDTAAFARALQTLADRHAVLRTSFVWKRLDKMLQVVHAHVEVPCHKEDWRDTTAAEVEHRLKAYLARDRAAGFDLSKAPLLRFALLQTADNEHRLVWSNHHILMDGWSLPVVVSDLFSLYEAYASGKEPLLPPVRPYRDYITWLQRQDAASAERFWRSRLGDFTEPVPFPAAGLAERARSDGAEFGKEEFSLSEQLTASIQEFARSHQLTLNTVVQGCWAILLYRYTAHDDVLFGATVSGRPAALPGSAQMVGLFINTLPVRARINAGTTGMSLFSALQEEQAEQREFEFSPLVQIHGYTGVPHTQPLFESIVVFENYPAGSVLQGDKGGLKVSAVRSYEQTNYPMTLAVSPGKRLHLTAAFNANRFAREAVKRMMGHLRNLLAAVVAQPHQKVSLLPMLNEKDVLEHRSAGQGPRVAYKEESLTLHERFEAMVRRSPDADAVVIGEKRFTYAELNSSANRLARFLRSNGLCPERIAALCLDRGVDAIVAMLAVLKTGAAYLPFDPAYPSERLSFMLHDSGASVLLTQRNLVEHVPQENVRTLCIDSERERFDKEDSSNLSPAALPDNLAYVIYTSGSTGRPKGTLLQHRGACNLAGALIEDWHIGPGSRVMQFASASFDASVAEIFSALLSGATLVLVDRETAMSVPALHRRIGEAAVTHITLPPSLLSALSEEGLPSLRSVASAGERCSWDIGRRWSGSHRFINGYGPTECTVGIAWNRAFRTVPGLSSVPIGCPIANTRMYIVDKNLQLVPDGVPGELCVGGPGLARGYIGRPELTAERFVPDPFSSGGERMYRTGDLVCRHGSGDIEVLGRIDQQVKVRGYRIEPGEIEACLADNASVHQAAVIVRPDAMGENILEAYCAVGDKAGDRSLRARLFEELKGRLPSFMVPGSLILIERMPLTVNGKVDRNELLRQNNEGCASRESQLPVTPTEELLAGLWAAILGTEWVGREDDFFERGGHSLRATQLVSRIREAFGIEVPLNAVFDHPTLSAMAAEIERIQCLASGMKGAGGRLPGLARASREGSLPMSYAQQRLWFLDQLEPGSSLYNISSAFRLKGPLHARALERSITEIVRRHEILRTTFSSASGVPVQTISDPKPVSLPLVDLSSFADREQRARVLIADEAVKPFRLSEGPLFRAVLVRVAGEEHMIVLTLHHIVADGWSFTVIVREIAALYQAFADGTESPLPELPFQYADYAHSQRAWLTGEVLEAELRYWKDCLRELQPGLDLATDRPRPAMQTFRGGTRTVRLSSEVSHAITAFSRREGVTDFMTLLAVLQTLLHRYTGQKDIAVGSPVANRTRSETEGLIGFFVNMLVLRTAFDGDPTFRELLKNVRAVCLGAYAHQEVPFEKIVEELQPERDLSRQPLFQVAFALQHAGHDTLSLGGLTITPVANESTTAKYDLTMTVSEFPGHFNIALEFNADLYDPQTIDRFLSHFQTITEDVMQDADRRVSTLRLMKEEELETTLYRWNPPATEYPDHATVHEWFAGISRADPLADALAFGDETMSYGSLNSRANQLAHFLVKAGAGPETLVGLCLDRSFDMVIGMLGILKAGAAFVPLDPSYPRDRLLYMIHDAGLQLIVSHHSLSARLSGFSGRVVCLGAEEETIIREDDEDPGQPFSPDQLAYVIYTSGSTGRPKGTMLRHRGLCNLAKAQMQAIHVGPGDRILQFSSLSFDASVWETVMALLSGATLCLVPRERLTGRELSGALLQEHITTITLPPSILSSLPDGEYPSLQTVIVAGEACPPDLVRRWSGGRKFFNAYGPTETTVCASLMEVRECPSQGPPIGRPLPNTRIHILDRFLRPVPAGVPGELCVAGIPLARGYLNQPAQTAEKFVPDPFGPGSGERMYRTGDLARRLSDGVIEFLGRIDAQVKVRGFRIEPGEIEAVLKTHADVQNAVVMVREDRPGDRRIVAYVMPRDGSVSIPELRTLVRTKLPEYMVPSAFVEIAAIPLSPSGKVDRRLLPAPEHDHRETGEEYVAPRNSTEEAIGEICRELLDAEKIGMNDNFFDLGGHSLLATQLVSRIQERFSVDLPLRTLFETPTIAGISAAVERISAVGGVLHQPPLIVQNERGEDNIEELVKEIAAMSAGDIRAALASERQQTETGHHE